MSTGRVLVVTGAAAAGKSTVGAGLAGAPGLLVLDGDLLATGAAAAGRRSTSTSTPASTRGCASPR